MNATIWDWKTGKTRKAKLTSRGYKFVVTWCGRRYDRTAYSDEDGEPYVRMGKFDSDCPNNFVHLNFFI